ncbi:hypothetical protein NC656_09350 [Pseudomonas asiatica]|uniref:hypothetical protein n=1 Tax=Pseudomonas asiatica TaxID=2219225 RepID=UPI00209C3FCA|nr:hypothetical protein [Pseudomonas asiatica]MCO8261753.1 hypothetical protein [Pseudomonas asiatica]
MQTYQIAHIKYEHNGDDVTVTCTACNYSEHVVGYKMGAKPKAIVVFPFCPDGMQYIKCERCGKLNNDPSPGR